MTPAPTPAMTAPARLCAALIAVLGLVGLAWQFHLQGDTPDLVPWGARAWHMARYYTHLTNLLLALYLARVALTGISGANGAMTLTLSILMVGIIYRLLLAPAEPLAAPNWYPDFILHVAIPVLMALWWLTFADKTLRLAALPIWLSLPALYCAYALIRGTIAGSYPYFFFDIGRFGVGQVLVYCAGLVAVFALCGLCLWATGRAMSRRRSPSL